MCGVAKMLFLSVKQFARIWSLNVFIFNIPYLNFFNILKIPDKLKRDTLRKKSKSGEG